MTLYLDWGASAENIGSIFNSGDSDKYFSLPISTINTALNGLPANATITNITLTTRFIADPKYGGSYKCAVGYGGSGSITKELNRVSDGSTDYWDSTISCNLNEIISGRQLNTSLGSYITYNIWTDGGYGKKSYYVGTKAGSQPYLDVTYSTPCTVTLNPNGGTVSPTTLTFSNGATYGTLPTPNRAGYNFLYWAKEDGTRVYSSTKISSSHTLVAQWQIKTYTVTFKDENGATLKTETVNHSSAATPPSDPVKADTAQWDYTFDGWYDANGNKWTSSTTITGDTVFTAQYTAVVQKYTVRWFNYDGTPLETDTGVPYGTKPVYNGDEPQRAGNAEHSYQFAGWNYDTENGITPSLGATYIDITAQFREIDNTYKVTWVNDGSVIETDEAVPYGDKPDYNGTTPTKPSDAQYDYDFIGWSTSVTDPPKAESELDVVKGDITYTAVYSATLRMYPVTVILFDSEVTSVYEYGTEVTIEAPKVIGYKFTKWTDGNTDNPRTVEVTGEATYQAVYERVPVPIIVNEEQRVTGVYIVPTTQTIVYVVSGEVPAVVANGVTVDDWSFRVSNSVPDNSYPAEKLYINETRVY